MPDNTVVRKTAHITNARAKELVAGDLQTAVNNHGKDKLAKAADVKVRTVEKWMAQGSLPDVDCLLNLADVDPAIFNALLAEKGWAGLRKSQSNPANDLEVAANLGHAVAEMIDRLRDGRRCHVDTAVLAALFRTLIPQMQAIVDEDNARRAA